MKNRIILLITTMLISFSVSAQLDRSIQPVGGPTPKIKLDKPKEFKLKNGIKVLVVENHKLPRVSYSLRIDGTPILEGEKAGVLSVLGQMLGNGTTSIEKDVFNEEIDYLGANVSIGFRSSFASSLTKHNDRILELMADAIINPLLTVEEFDKTKEQLIESLKADEKSIDAIGSRVGNALSYGKNHVYGEFITEETLNKISYEDVIDFHKKYTYPNSAYIVVIGDVNYKEVKKSITEKFSVWKKAKKVENDVPVLTPNVELTEVNFIDLPSATQSSIGVTNNVELKMNVASKQNLHKLYEELEFSNRQCKFVINGQRLYEFFDYQWRLPLWDSLYIDFWESAPLEEKLNQKLYKKTLHNTNWCNVWNNIPVNPTNSFSLEVSVLRLLFKGIFLFTGKNAWHNFEKKYKFYI